MDKLQCFPDDGPVHGNLEALFPSCRAVQAGRSDQTRVDSIYLIFNDLSYCRRNEDSVQIQPVQRSREDENLAAP